MDVIQRYQRLREQRAYERRVGAFGLPELLAPYKATAVPAGPVVPQQRRRTAPAVVR